MAGLTNSSMLHCHMLSPPSYPRYPEAESLDNRPKILVQILTRARLCAYSRDWQRKGPKNHPLKSHHRRPTTAFWSLLLGTAPAFGFLFNQTSRYPVASISSVRIITIFKELKWDHFRCWSRFFSFSFFFFFFFASPHSTQGLSSLTWNQPPPPGVEAGSLNHWTFREVPKQVFLLESKGPFRPLPHNFILLFHLSTSKYGS